MSSWKDNQYTRVLRGPRWARFRQKALDHYGRECSRCGSTTRLEVHHRDYATLGRELLSDVEIVCWKCHPDADRERREAAQEAPWDYWPSDEEYRRRRAMNETKRWDFRERLLRGEV